jgi:hypothetical protein
VSNYPPGVSGNEYAINGPDTETDAHLVCSRCADEGCVDASGLVDATVFTYGRETWAVCVNGHDVEVPW